jgi:cupin 2 domain-containing protein
MNVGNLFAAIPSTLPEELVQVLLERPGLRLERIVSRGHGSAPGFWYDQAEDEWVLLTQGEAELRFEAGDRLVTLRAGDYLHIPASRRHRVERTSRDPEAVWLALFFPANPDGT